MVDVCVVHMCTIDSIFVSAEEREARRHFNSRHLSQAALKMQRGGMESAVAAAVGEMAAEAGDYEAGAVPPRCDGGGLPEGGRGHFRGRLRCFSLFALD